MLTYTGQPAAIKYQATKRAFITRTGTCCYQATKREHSSKEQVHRWDIKIHTPFRKFSWCFPLVNNSLYTTMRFLAIKGGNRYSCFHNLQRAMVHKSTGEKSLSSNPKKQGKDALIFPQFGIRQHLPQWARVKVGSDSRLSFLWNTKEHSHTDSCCDMYRSSLMFPFCCNM